MKHDVVVGFSDNAFKYLLALGCFAVVCALFFVQHDASARLLESTGASFGNDGFSLADVMAYASAGMAPYVPSKDNPFMLPIAWLVLQVVVALLVASYPADDLSGYAPQILVRTRSLWAWWLSKCMWIVLTVAAFYMIGFFVFWAFASLAGGPSASSAAVSALVNGFSLQLDAGGLVLVLAVVVALSLALSLVQVALSLIVGPFASFFILMAYYLVSIYFNNLVLIGDYSMLARSSLVRAGGIDPTWALGVCAGASVIALAAGGLALRRRDILGNALS